MGPIEFNGPLSGGRTMTLTQLHPPSHPFAARPQIGERKNGSVCVRALSDQVMNYGDTPLIFGSGTSQKKVCARPFPRCIPWCGRPGISRAASEPWETL